jgi:hypothetical protein
MSSFDFIMYGIILSVVGIVLFIVGLFNFKRKHFIETIPTSKIRSIAMGLVEIYGEVVPMNNTMKSPFTFLPCVYYKYRVEELRSSGKSTYWATIKEGSECSLFYLRDETGSVMVYPKGAEIDIPVDNTFRSGTGRDPPAGVQQFLINNNLSHEGWLFGFNKTMRYNEWFIAPGDHLYILGTATDNPYKAEATAFNSVEDVLITKGEQNKLFYISDKSERQIVERLNLFVYGGLIGGISLIVIGLVMLL